MSSPLNKRVYHKKITASYIWSLLSLKYPIISMLLIEINIYLFLKTNKLLCFMKTLTIWPTSIPRICLKSIFCFSLFIWVLVLLTYLLKYVLFIKLIVNCLYNSYKLANLCLTRTYHIVNLLRFCLHVAALIHFYQNNISHQTCPSCD